MGVIYSRCCGLDIHKKTVVACLMMSEAGQPAVKTIRTCGTMTADLLALADWLHTAGCTHVAMDSTGVYWRPIDNLLEGLFTLFVVNAQHMKAVPGRNTDVKDAEWIADLLRHGLLRASFINEADLSRGPLPTDCRPTWEEARAHGRRPHDSEPRVDVADPQATVSGPRRHLR
jgi:transposase